MADDSVVLPDGAKARSLIAQAISASPSSPRTFDLVGAIQDIKLETQILGASMLVINVIDPDWTLQSFDCFQPDADGILPPIDVEYPSGSAWWWRLAMEEGSIDRSGANFTLTFQDRIIAFLRQHWGPKTWPAGKAGATRAQFIQMLVREVGVGQYAGSPWYEVPINFVCPSLNVVQPVASSDTTDVGQVTVDTTAIHKAKETKKNKLKGIATGATYTIGGAAPTNAQKDNVSTVLSVIAEEKASKLAALALLVACVQESRMENLGSGDGTSRGILQFTSGTATGLGINQMNVAECCLTFLKRSYYYGGVTGEKVNYGPSPGGAMQVARLNPALTPGQLAQAIQGSAYEDGRLYQKWVSEAQDILGHGGFTPGSVDSASSTASDVSQLQRGTTESPDEDSWDCIQRLSQQVGWYAFTYGDTIFYMDGDDLIGQQPSGTFDRLKDRARIAAFRYTYDNTAFLYQSTHKRKSRIQRRSRIARPQTPSEVQLSLVCGTTDFRAGDVFVFQSFGPATGRWVVSDTTRNELTDTFTQFTLVPPLAPYPEPKADSGSVAPSSSPSTGGGQNSGGSKGSGTYSDPAQAALAALAQKSKYVYSEGSNRMNGGTLFGPSPRTMDCSAFAILCYKTAGWPDPSGNNYNGFGYTGDMQPNCVAVSSPQPGDLVFYGPAPVPLHVTVYVGNGNVVSMGTQGDPSQGPWQQMGPAPPTGGTFWRPRNLTTKFGSPSAPATKGQFNSGAGG